MLILVVFLLPTFNSKHFPCPAWQVAKIFGQCKSFEDLNYSTDPKTGCTVHAFPTCGMILLRRYWSGCSQCVQNHDSHDNLIVTNTVILINSMEFVSLAVLSLRICHTNGSRLHIDTYFIWGWGTLPCKGFPLRRRRVYCSCHTVNIDHGA